MEILTQGTTEDCEHFREINRKLGRGIARFFMRIAFVLLSTFFFSLWGTIFVLSVYAIFYNSNPWGIPLPWLGIPETRGQGISDLLRLILSLSILLVMAITDLGGRKYWVGMAQCASKLFRKNEIQG